MNAQTGHIANLPAIEQQLAMLGWFSSDYIGILAMGLFYGLTLCSFSCLPLLAPYLFAHAQQSGAAAGFMPAFHLTAMFILARVLTYGALGLAAGLIGERLLAWLDGGLLLPVAGGMVVLVGIAVMFGGRRAASCGVPGGHGSLPARLRRQANARKPGARRQGFLHMAGLGVATSLMPCLPLTAVLMLAAMRGSAMEGALYGLLFGAGAAASPLYYIGGATGWLATRIRQEIPRYAPFLRRLSGLMLVLFGLRAMFPA
jgi:sulfite exporter TauE/SafE